MSPPDYSGGSLVNLIAELETRLIGSAPSPRLHSELSNAIPEGETYVFVLFDGLGSSQLAHANATRLAVSSVATIDACFPTTTTVSMASVATGLPPSQHGLIAYQLWLPEVAEVVNTLKWTTLWGDHLDIDHEGFLPAPALAERLAASGVESMTVQPGNFDGTPLSKVLYRGNRFEAAFSEEQIVDATLALAAEPGRLVFAYVPHIDVAAHVWGQDSDDYGTALSFASDIWEKISRQLPPGVVMVGTADHGHVDVPPENQIRIPDELHEGRILYGDSRAMFVKGDGAILAEALPATWVDIADLAEWWGPGPFHVGFEQRLPDGVLFADPGHLLLHRHSDTRLIGHHGGITDAELKIPLLVA
ncbi:MAG: alkaline phosphatase family protein [Acidimicrobiia bacterium]|nr:alkaline phosphatase family protein [Acidimicrobiia bacterium]